jgi:hypothetical protein
VVKTKGTGMWSSKWLGRKARTEKGQRSPEKCHECKGNGDRKHSNKAK